MGYYTQYNLEMIEGSSDLIEGLLSECEEARYALGASGDCEQATKWYEHKRDMISFSKKHPDALFKLSGEGEESGDCWHEYYKNGKVQECKAKIVYPEFNEDLLA